MMITLNEFKQGVIRIAKIIYDYFIEHMSSIIKLVKKKDIRKSDVIGFIYARMIEVGSDLMMSKLSASIIKGSGFIMSLGDKLRGMFAKVCR